jgi:hypothetical protein
MRESENCPIIQACFYRTDAVPETFLELKYRSGRQNAETDRVKCRLKVVILIIMLRESRRPAGRRSAGRTTRLHKQLHTHPFQKCRVVGHIACAQLCAKFQLLFPCHQSQCPKPLPLTPEFCAIEPCSAAYTHIRTATW